MGSQILVKFIVEYWEQPNPELPNCTSATYEIDHDYAVLDTETRGVKHDTLSNSYDNEPIKQHWIIMPSGTRVPIKWDSMNQSFRIQEDDESEDDE